jgi:N-terminal domain of NWD NACHT-NTPase
LPDSSSKDSPDTETGPKEFWDDAENKIGIPDQETRKKRLDAIIDLGLERVKAKEIKYQIAGHEFVLQEQFGQVAHFVDLAKDWIGDAVKASPEASTAWAGVCLVLPLITGGIEEKEACSSGFIYVSSRLRLYCQQELAIIPESQQDGGEFTKLVVSLYQLILEFQIKFVLRCYRGRFVDAARLVAGLDNWESTLETVKKLEKDIDVKSKLINAGVSRQHLEEIEKNTGQFVTNMDSLIDYVKQTLSVLEESKIVQKESRDIQNSILDAVKSQTYSQFLLLC